MKSFVIKSTMARRCPDPVIPGAQRHILMCPVRDLPGELPKDPNPRAQNIDRAIWREIRQHLLNVEGEPNTFHLKNKGITIIAAGVEKLSEDSLKLVLDEGDGIVDGGHTYDLIIDALADIDALGTKADYNQHVKLEILTGLPRPLATEIAGGLNTAVQVQAFSLANNRTMFDWIKEAIADHPYADQIAFRENERKPYDARDVIALLDLYNITSFPNENGDHPIRAYTQKQKVLEHYMSHVEEYQVLDSVLPDILSLHDLISLEARDLHNKSGGRAGHLAFVESRSHGKYDFHFIASKGDYQLSKGALFPMLAAFRWMLSRGPDGQIAWIGGFESVVQLWRDVGQELMKATQATSDEVGRKANAIGRSKNHWANVHNIVAKRHLMLSRLAS